MTDPFEVYIKRAMAQPVTKHCLNCGAEYTVPFADELNGTATSICAECWKLHRPRRRGWRTKRRR